MYVFKTQLLMNCGYVYSRFRTISFFRQTNNDVGLTLNEEIILTKIFQYEFDKIFPHFVNFYLYLSST